jgi:hypothetical protein
MLPGHADGGVTGQIEDAAAGVGDEGREEIVYPLARWPVRP